MRNLLFISPSTPQAVRTKKFVDYFNSRGFVISFIGWHRKSEKPERDDCINKEMYIMRGGGHGTRILPLLYCLFIVKLFFKLLTRKEINKEVVFAVNFESAFAVWLASNFRKIDYIYDIWDELAISHNFTPLLKRIVRSIDKRIRRSSYFYIHVDSNRLSEIDSPNHVIVYNSPCDFFNGAEREVHYKKEFAVTGFLNDARGLHSIKNFAKNNLDYKFIVVGEFISKETEREYLSIPNVEYHHFMPQNQLFNLIQHCRGIFSLYDTHVPIYRLAASNKLYDAMMLSIPVIVNKEILAASFVEKKRIGYVVNYNYDESWLKLINSSVEDVRLIGENGRKCYLEEYEFISMLEKRILPRINKLDS